ncbi:hypothetical protein SAMN05428975_1424 [Mucilaginibacter sp. OK268]|uniref:hypothetical protein n=1 Tax=Mucilaginibacter sp. OK268 TaxID=1881048 RepID=UPI00087F8496|nr:hypothetical protein [Mucilaginibacter sp. OK268]SDP48643.1 hypothetical protein SAMN05428975_1424 [Mucilaginibacter sp. OK268]
MNQIQLYLNNQLVDLSDDSPIALTFQINNLAEVKNQQGNTSNQFKLPLTQRNRQILGFPDDVLFTTNLPYDNYEARIIQDGLEIVPSAIAQLNLIEQDTASVTVLSGNVDFFDVLDVKIYDMGDNTTDIGKQNAFVPYQHTWDLNKVAHSQNNTSGYIWPVVDYGRIATDFLNNPQIDVRYQRPGFFLKTAIELFAQTAGYKIDQSSFLLKQPMYDKLIVQFANDNFEHGTDYQNSATLGVNASLGDALNVSHPGVQNNIGTVVFKNVINSDQNYQASAGRYVAKAVTKVTITVKIPSFYFYGKFVGDYASNLDINIIYTDPSNGELKLASHNFDLKNNIVIDKQSGFFNLFAYKNTTDPVTLSTDAELPIGGQLHVGYEFKGYTGSRFSMPGGTELTIKADNQDVLFGQDIQCERIFPDITQKDLLKDALQRFGIICQTNNTTRTVTFSSFRDIVNNIPVATNWTSKCVDQGKTVSFQLGNYAQVNTITYKEDDAILPKNFGNSQINVADKTLPLTTALFESQFAPTLNRSYIGGNMAQILKIDTTQDADAVDFSINTQPRLLIDQKIDLRQQNGAPSVTFTDGLNHIMVNDIISVPYFYKPGGEFSLLWEDLRIAYYPELEKILRQTKKIVRYFLLSPRDILELNLLIPVYLEQDGCYYYINKIDSWRSGQPTKVELVKLG